MLTRLNFEFLYFFCFNGLPFFSNFFGKKQKQKWFDWKTHSANDIQNWLLDPMNRLQYENVLQFQYNNPIWQICQNSTFKRQNLSLVYFFREWFKYWQALFGICPLLLPFLLFNRKSSIWNSSFLLLLLVRLGAFRGIMS